MVIAEGIPRSPSSPAEAADGAGKPARSPAGDILALSGSACAQAAADATPIAPPSGTHHPDPGAQPARAGTPGTCRVATGLLAPRLDRPAAGGPGA